MKAKLKRGSILSDKAGNVDTSGGMKIIYGIVAIVVLVISGGALWGIFGDGVTSLSNEGICEQAGGYYNISATHDCETASASGIEQGGYYPNPLSALFDASTGIPQLLLGVFIFVGMVALIMQKNKKNK